MRTTLTLDEDVAQRLRRLARGNRFKDVVNRALRIGLKELEAPGAPMPEYETTPVEGRPRIRNLDNVAEVLAETDGDDAR